MPTPALRLVARRLVATRVIAASGTVLLWCVATPVHAARAQEAPLDSAALALAYHELSGDSIDLQAVAARSPAVRRATSFDRRDAQAAEVARLQAMLAAAAEPRTFVVRVNDHVSEYDHDRGEFSVGLFLPGYFVPVRAFGQEYRLVFANAEAARPIPMAREEARAFDAILAARSRHVVNEIAFRVTGGGDPSGAVTGPRVVRAELVSVRLLDREGRVVYEPRVAPVAVASAPLDPALADVAGFRVGVKARDLEATLRRLFGPVTRREVRAGGGSPYAATLVVNELGCTSVPGRRQRAEPGAVCVTAFLDAGDVVRAIRVERVFPPMDGETFRRALVQKYGPVDGASSGGGLTLGWGPPVDVSLVHDRSGPHVALTARWDAAGDYTSRMMGAAQNVKVALQLVDAAWAATAERHP